VVSLLDAKEKEIIVVPPGVSPVIKAEDEKLIKQDKDTYEELKRMAKEDPKEAAAIDEAIKENPDLFGSDTSNDILKGINDVMTAIEDVTDPAKLNTNETKKLLQHIVDDDTIYDDIQRIDDGLEKLLIPENKDNPEYNDIYSDYYELNRLDEELKRERKQLKLDMSAVPQDPAKIKADLEEIKRTEEELNTLKNKTEIDVAKFYYYQSLKNEPSYTNFTITASNFITILTGLKST